MVEPIEMVGTVIDAVNTVYDVIQEVRSHKRRCATLSSKLQAIEQPLQELRSEPRENQARFAKALEALLGVLDGAKKFVIKLKQMSLIERLVKYDKIRCSFDEIYTGLTRSEHDLMLGLLSSNRQVLHDIKKAMDKSFTTVDDKQDFMDDIDEITAVLKACEAHIADMSKYSDEDRAKITNCISELNNTLLNLTVEPVVKDSGVSKRPTAKSLVEELVEEEDALIDENDLNAIAGSLSSVLDLLPTAIRQEDRRLVEAFTSILGEDDLNNETKDGKTLLQLAEESSNSDILDALNKLKVNA